jgi:hypothetical protein
MKIKKYIAIILIALTVFVRLGSSIALAEDVPVPPTTPEAPVAPSAPTAPEAPTAPTAPEAPNAPSAPTAPTAPEAPSAPTAPTAPEAPVAPSAPKNPYTSDTNTESVTNPYNGTSANGNVGDTSINTGDASNNSNINTTGNNNGSASGCCTNGTAIVSNTDNGAESVNNGSATTTTNNGTSQGNSAVVANNMNQTTNTGGNDANMNVGSSSINSGDANTTGTIVTSVNTNVDGITISEFNIVDDHVGDILLDFGANCIAGCGGTSLAANNSNNGAYSYNQVNASTATNNTTDQINNANVGNDMTLVANSGYNDTSFNTGGNNTITTGDANVSANAVTFANNNIAGDIIYGVVNIFGDLVGDIILTQEMMDFICGGTCGGNTSAANIGNGANTTNLANATSTTNDNVFQANDATITNTMLLDAVTGENDVNFNTGGNNTITTGAASIDANIINIANMNLIGGNMWLVIVNEAGNWVGKLYGANGGNVAASALMEFFINPLTGAVTATNSDNGADSVNQANATNTTNNSINQTNNAVVNNTMTLTANTGGNTANFNTSGDSAIKTGDANIVANIVNFVNNNIVGDGKLVITVVNVFGSWLGDFLTPGSTKTKVTQQTVEVAGAPQAQSTQASNNGSSNQNSSVASQNGGTNAVVALINNSGAAKLVKYVPFFGNTNIKHVALNTKPLVAGINQTAIAGESAMTINLAWLLLLIPAFAGIALISRKLYIRKSAL